MPVILANQEVKVEGSQSDAGPGQKHETLLEK
jgi:hypothetical protein